MVKVKRALTFLSFFLFAAFSLNGCSAVQNGKCASFCDKNYYAAKRSVVKKVKVSECARRVKTVVYNDICTKCSYPVTVRENNCCSKGGCR